MQESNVEMHSILNILRMSVHKEEVTGRTRTFSNEHRQNISAAMSGLSERTQHSKS